MLDARTPEEVAAADRWLEGEFQRIAARSKLRHIGGHDEDADE